MDSKLKFMLRTRNGTWCKLGFLISNCEGRNFIMARETKEAKIARLESLIKKYEDVINHLTNRNKELVAAEEETFLHSPTYLQMQEHLSFVKDLLELTEINLANQKKTAMKIEDTVRQVYEDNKRLVAEKANGEYFAGITEFYHDSKEYMSLKDENMRLSAKVDTLKESLKERETEIERLQLLLAEQILRENHNPEAEQIPACRKKGR